MSAASRSVSRRPMAPARLGNDLFRVTVAPAVPPALVGQQEFRVNTTTASDQFSPAITVLTDGGYVVCWASNGQDGSNAGIYAQRYDGAGAPVGGETQINSTTAGDSTNLPAITATTDGGYVVSWISFGQDDNGWGIYSQRYDAAGAPLGGETRVNTTTASDQYEPAITALADGGIRGELAVARAGWQRLGHLRTTLRRHRHGDWHRDAHQHHDS